MSFKHVLVTGGAGFIGSHVVDRLVQDGYRVRVLDSLEFEAHQTVDEPPGFVHPAAEFIRGNILDELTLRRSLTGIDAVVHLGALGSIGQSQYQVARYTQNNVLGMARLLDVIVNERTNVERLLVASSLEVYGEGLYRRLSDGSLIHPAPRSVRQLLRHDFEVRDYRTGEPLHPVPTPESTACNSQSVYGATMRAQEELALCAGRAHRIGVTIARYPCVYGPRQPLSNPHAGIIALMATRILNGHSPLIYEDGQQTRDFLNIRDLLDASMLLLENHQTENEVYNVCSGWPITIRQLAEHMLKLYRRPDLPVHITNQYRMGDARHSFGDSLKMAALGWLSSRHIEDGLQEMVDWSRTQRPIDRVDIAHQELISRGLVLD